MFKPLLAPQDDPKKRPTFFEDLPFHLHGYLLGSPKIDGIRCVVKDYACKSRKFLDLRSKQVQEAFSAMAELDGELTVGNETDQDLCNRTYSHVMSFDKPCPDHELKFRIFDCADMTLANEPFYERLEHANRLVKEYSEAFGETRVSIIEHEPIYSLEGLLDYEERQLALGYEGVMIRTPGGRYKHNRATWNDHIIYKLKRFEDIEVRVVGFEEEQTNTNVDVRSELGYAKRSKNAEGLVGSGTLGKLVVDYNGEIETVGCGSLKKDERQHIWDNMELYRNRIATIRHFPKGQKDKLRFGRFVSWRDHG